MDHHLLSRELEKSNFIVFALLFGSLAENRATRISDTDIGIYTNRDVSLLEIGEIITRLEKITASKVDLIILNDLFKKRPVLACEIVSTGQLLLCQEQEKFIEFKKNTFLYYLDTAPLRHAVDRHFRERLNENRSGERNYAGTA
jgi:predicted nucleotidyltransferase